MSHHPFQGEIDELVACILEGRETHLNVFDAQKTMECAWPPTDRRRKAAGRCGCEADQETRRRRSTTDEVRHERHGRQFLNGGGRRRARLPRATQASQRPRRLFKISLAQWSLHRTLRAEELDNLDFARVAKQDFGIEAIEYVNQFFKDKARRRRVPGRDEQARRRTTACTST